MKSSVTQSVEPDAQLDAFAAGVSLPVIFARAGGVEGEPIAAALEGSRTVELARESGARELDPALNAAPAV